MTKLAVVTVATLHHFLLWSLMFAPFWLIYYSPWYVSIPIIVFILRITTSRERCLLTELEDYFRGKLDWQLLNGKFIRYYYIKRLS
jgi:hypothetical protein